MQDASVQNFSIGATAWQLRMPDGYHLELLVRIERPRMLAFADDGAALVGSYAGKVYRIPQPYDRATIFAQLPTNNVHGVAIHDRRVWIARENGVYRIPYRPRSTPYRLQDFEHVAHLPARNGGHSSRTIKVGPDRRIYVSLGISGNCSDEYLGSGYAFEDWRGGIVVLRAAPATAAATSRGGVADAGRTHWQVQASGLRNPVGFDWHPQTQVMYASNHGPDHLGYAQPGEYFSRILPGSFHGMPWFWFDGVRMQRDACIRRTPPRADATLPLALFPARNGPMDVAFIPAGALDPTLENAAVVALHGSWATQPAGGFLGDSSTRRPPWIALVPFERNAAQPAVTGLIEGMQNASGERLMRPVGLAFGTDAALYLTSDGGAIEGLFRFSRKSTPR